MHLDEWLETDLQKDIWKMKYQHNDETLEEWFDRVSGGNAVIRKFIKQKKFLFGGRILASRGLDKLGKKISLSNCYVASVDDSIESIFETAKGIARTYSYGGGVGLDISNLRPKNFKVNNAAKETTGAVSFMELYDVITALIGQAGRRAALMISIADNHPDVEEFIELKSDLGKATKANISIRITNKFMNAVKEDKNFELYFKCKDTGEEIKKEVKAKELFNKIAEMNWDYAEPGFIMWDRINNWNLLSEDKNFEYAGVNPCAEEPLPAGGSCLLGSINLSEFVKDDRFDFFDFEKCVTEAVSALNEVLNEGLPLHPLQEQRESVSNWRQIGLGIFGLADMLIKLKIKYGSTESLELCSKIGFTMIDNAIFESSILAKHNSPYPNYNSDAVLKSEFFLENTTYDTKAHVEDCGLYNSQLLTCAPTGTLSTLLGVSGGIEPVYELSYTRKTESLHNKDAYYEVFTPIVKKYMEENNISSKSDLPEYFVTAMNLDYLDRIKMQSVWQKYIDASISSTINLKNSATIEDVKDIYMKSWEYGLKGVTVFRDGCKRVGILTTTKEEDTPILKGEAIKCSDNMTGLKRKIITGCGSLHVKAYFDNETGDLLEVFLSKGSTGGCQGMMIGLSRALSYGLRSGASLEGLVDQLESVPICPAYAVRTATKKDTSRGSNCPSAVGKKLKEMQNEMLNKETKESNPSTNACPECNEPLVMETGCVSCKSCGWSKCE